jgi:4a-hydroxytetrahydrobiopterin dehydratase
MSIYLSEKRCVACEGGIPPLTKLQAEILQKELSLKWSISNDTKQISAEFIVTDFKEAIQLVNEVARIAEEEGHHPDIAIHYNKVLITLWTHAINGLSENDFILAAKIEKLPLLHEQHKKE